MVVIVCYGAIFVMFEEATNPSANIAINRESTDIGSMPVTTFVSLFTTVFCGAI